MAPRAPGDSVRRPRRPAGASVRPLSFTVRRMQGRSSVDRPLAYFDALVVVAIVFATVWNIRRQREAFAEALRIYGRAVIIDPPGIEPAVMWLYVAPFVLLFTLSSLAMWRRWRSRWFLQAVALLLVALVFLGTFFHL